MLIKLSIVAIGTSRLSDENLISNLWVAARLLIATHWKSVFVPSKKEWLQNVRYTLLMNKLRPPIGSGRGI